MIEPAYSFTIPSLHDDLPLDCRIYHPRQFDVVPLGAGESEHPVTVRGAVIAHPYAPMGGSYDDPLVVSVMACLLQEGFVVGTFNFRGAPGSKGNTSWTGRAEREDYTSFVGFMMYYLQRILPSQKELQRLSTIASISDGLTEPENSDPVNDGHLPSSKISLLLAGYSYGSLILSRLPVITTIINRFEESERGTAAAEIILRARRVARETEETIMSRHRPSSSRGRNSVPTDSASPSYQRTGFSGVVVGGEETDPAQRRKSRESTRSTSIVRKGAEVPHRIKAHIRRRSSGRDSPKGDGNSPKTQAQVMRAKPDTSAPSVVVRYLLISPLLPPISHALVSPSTFAALLGTSKGTVDNATGVGSLKHPTLAIWGASDAFTSNRRLKGWSERLANQSQEPSQWTWAEIDKGGHFWREQKAVQTLIEHIRAWVKRSEQA